jgi:hypothetical protein
MGSRGPVPQRSDQRRRTNANPGGEITKAAAGASRPRGSAARAASPGWHPLIRDLYFDIRKSGQAAFYEPSDWGMLRIGCEVMSENMLSAKPSAVMFASWDALMARLLVTEGDRRRMRMELERGKVEDPDEAAAVASMTDYRGKPRAV